MRLYTRLFVPDTHAPYHDERAFNLMLDVAKEIKPDEIVVLGDFFDCYAVSSYTKDPKRYQLLEEELQSGRDLLRRLERASRASSFVFLQGNHEHRIDRYVAANASALGGSINTRDVLQLTPNWKFIPYGQKNVHHCGPKLVATHGSICNLHVCAAMLKKYGTSVIFGHTHRFQQFQEKDVFGERKVAMTCGWLGDAEHAQEYIMNVSSAQHGFAISTHKPNGDFFLTPVEILKHQLLWDGKLRG